MRKTEIIGNEIFWDNNHNLLIILLYVYPLNYFRFNMYKNISGIEQDRLARSKWIDDLYTTRENQIAPTNWVDMDKRWLFYWWPQNMTAKADPSVQINSAGSSSVINRETMTK